MPSIPIAVQDSRKHSLAGHPESPERYARFGELFRSPVADSIDRIGPSPIDEALLRRVHSPVYLESLQIVDPGEVRFLDYGDTYLTSSSYDCARLAAGAVVEVCNTVLESEATTGFALARPPGHHATATRAMGFCLFNNVALAARHMQSRGLQRLLIIDFDVHHGNGTQEIFYRDGDIFYASTHQRGIFPGTGIPEETGLGRGFGTNLNIPLPAFSGDQVIQRVFRELIVPFAGRARPDAVIVSAGYDGHRSDPLANLCITDAGFHAITSEILDIAIESTSGKAVFVLEGGYRPDSLFGSILATLYSMLGRPLEGSVSDSPGPEPDISELITTIRGEHNL